MGLMLSLNFLIDLKLKKEAEKNKSFSASFFL